MRQVTAAVIVEGGRILLARRAAGEKLAGLWELPGGKIEPGETPQRCLERELLEELDMVASVSDILATTVYTYDHGEFQMLALRATRSSTYALSVHDAVGWFSRDELQSLDLAPADVRLVAELAGMGVI